MRRPLSLLFLSLAALAAGQEQPPLIVFAGSPPPAIAQEASARGWRVAPIDASAGLKGIDQAAADPAADPTRVYLAGPGDIVLYAASRFPDRWAAALAIGGDPRRAVETNRIFSANLQLVPMLWIAGEGEAAAVQALRSKLRGIEVKPAASFSASAALDWLAGRRREPFPTSVDCETGALEFARCYWAEIVAFDFSQRNDILSATRVDPGSGALLALGGFAYRSDDPGPGVLVSWLPENYKGPLKIGDRIVAVAGKPFGNAAEYEAYMNGIKEEKRVVAMVQRGKDRMRVETRVALPRREEVKTARLKGERLADAGEIMLVSRGAGALRVHLPAHWTPARVTWNGQDFGTAGAAGCWALDASGRLSQCPDAAATPAKN